MQTHTTDVSTPGFEVENDPGQLPLRRIGSADLIVVTAGYRLPRSHGAPGKLDAASS